MISLRGYVHIALLSTFVVLVGCIGPAEPIWATDEEVARAVYVDDGPPTLTLFTVINNKTGFGAHTGLMISASQRIIYDPAGTWWHPQLPERNDVHFGMSDAIVDFYVDYHSRVTYRTVIQTVVVTPEVAQAAMDAALVQGAAPKGYCARATTAILAQVPGFEGIGRTWFPNKLMREFAKIPGVTTETVYDNDPGDNSGVIAAPPPLYLQGT